MRFLTCNIYSHFHSPFHYFGYCKVYSGKLWVVICVVWVIKVVQSWSWLSTLSTRSLAQAWVLKCLLQSI